jgi:hypothetical protein
MQSSLTFAAHTASEGTLQSVNHQDEAPNPATTWRHGLLALGVGIFAAMVILLLFEGGCRIIEYYQKSLFIEETHPSDFNKMDAVLGCLPGADLRIEATKKAKDGRLLFSAEYSIDGNRRRITPVEETHARNSFMVFFGCSFMFGQGLNDNQTLPYFLARELPCYRPYNYGFIGYGPQQMLAKLEAKRLPNEIKEKRGIAFYGYMGQPVIGHIDRAIGTLHVHGWTKYFPYYYLDENGVLQQNDSFMTGRPLRSKLFNILRHTAIVRVLKLNYPFRINDDDVKLTAKIIEESKKAFAAQFPGSGFYVIIFPGADPRTTEKLISALRTAGINCLDYSRLQEFGQEGYRIAEDEHPSEKWNERLAQIIAGDVNEAKRECDRAPEALKQAGRR